MTNAWATRGLSGLWANFFGNMIPWSSTTCPFLAARWMRYCCTFYRTTRHSSKTFASHECDVFGCTDCWVIDGHLKNRRFICATKHINFVKVEGFPNGGFFEGCKKKPAPEKLFCSDCLKHTMEGGPVSGKLDLKNKKV